MRRLILLPLLLLCALAHAQRWPLGANIGTLQVPYNTGSDWGALSLSGSGSICMTTSCSMTTPALGAATATSITDSGLTSGDCVQASTGGLLTTTGSACGSGGGGLTSVGLSTTASWFTVGNSPLTAPGTITMNPTSGLTANEFLATPNGSSGAVGLRAIVPADIPTLNQSTTGNAATATALAATPSQCSGGAVSTGVAASGNANCTSSAPPLTLASGSQALGTSAISSGACATTIQVAVTGGTTSDTAFLTPTTDPNTVTGYKASASGALYVNSFMTSGELNIEVCNNTSSSITPSAMSVHYLVTSP